MFKSMFGKKNVTIKNGKNSSNTSIKANNVNKSTIKDTTLRSVVFNKKDVSVKNGANSHKILIETNSVNKYQFDKYEDVLKIMARLSRLIYCDSGIIREVIISPEFKYNDNKAVNDLITLLDSNYNNLRRTTTNYTNSEYGRPMESYVIQESLDNNKDNLLGTYISSPSDLTCLFLKGSDFTGLADNFFKPSDLIIVFKGSSTAKNFQHDILSQVLPPKNLKDILSPMIIKSTKDNNIVPVAFVTPIIGIWDIIKDTLNKYKPQNGEKQRIFITGHSLGGAFASMLTFILAELSSSDLNYIESIHNITFGAPLILSDGARNTFNGHLTSGKVTLDRIISKGTVSKLFDPIPSVPIGFSHPGFQPLRTEFYPESKTGRAYSFDTIRKVYQKGAGIMNTLKSVKGVFRGPEKVDYEAATKINMPNLIIIPANTKIVQPFTHSEYFDMTFLGAFRLRGMKNPGFVKDGTYYTFVADLYETGINFKYIIVPKQEAKEDPSENKTMSDVGVVATTVAKAVEETRAANAATVAPINTSNVKLTIGGKKKKHNIHTKRKRNNRTTRKNK